MAGNSLTLLQVGAQHDDPSHQRAYGQASVMGVATDGSTTVGVPSSRPATRRGWEGVLPPGPARHTRCGHVVVATRRLQG